MVLVKMLAAFINGAYSQSLYPQIQILVRVVLVDAVHMARYLIQVLVLSLHQSTV